MKTMSVVGTTFDCVLHGVTRCRRHEFIVSHHVPRHIKASAVVVVLYKYGSALDYLVAVVSGSSLVSFTALFAHFRGENRNVWSIWSSERDIKVIYA